MTSEARSWTVMTWNLRGSAKPALDRVAATVRAEEPDVVVLQEVRRSQGVQLAQALAMRFTWALKHYPWTPLLRGAAEGMAILTPHALDAAGHSEISEGRSRWTYRRRIAQWALVGRPDTSAYRVYNLHLSPHDRSFERRSEAVAVADIVAGHGDAPPAIIAGDFNDDTDGSIIYALPGIEHLTPSPTNPAESPAQTLDHVLLPPEARNVTVTVPAGGSEWAELSDHLPVTVRFTLDWVTGDFT
ncbi:MAG: hypothetical protein HKN44_14825 [Ilumatobacter sp.]|nr:hypothetical protein [Ilumatobacter sp.]